MEFEECTVFVSIPFSEGINPKEKRRRLYKIFKVCRFSTKKMEYFYKYYVPYMHMNMSEEDFDEVLNRFELDFGKNLNNFQ